MKKIKLVRGRSYADGKISVSRACPVASVSDEDAAFYLDSGYFEENADKSEENDIKNIEMHKKNAEKSKEIKKPSASDQLKAELQKMKVTDLKDYAEKHGVITKSSRKETLIAEIMKADARAQEAREALRSE